MNRNDCLREALVFLDSVSSQYPGGIPKNLVEKSRPLVEKPAAFLHFIGAITPAGQKVLEAALAQGLKLDPSNAIRSPLSEKVSAASSTLQEFVDAKLKEHPAHVAVLMGSAVAKVLFDAPSAEAVDEDGFVTYKGQRALLTDDLCDVASDAQAKKRFWNELKKSRALFTKMGLL
ncbi:MAG: hypothetical protein J0M12_12125 [Deltaproteobacteria bacterium]|nr:hypothetical protein [Deltaproteobacteria bacterium]